MGGGLISAARTENIITNHPPYSATKINIKQELQKIKTWENKNRESTIRVEIKKVFFLLISEEYSLEK